MGFLARYDWPTGNSQQQQLKIMWLSQWRTKSWNKELKWRPGWLRKTVSYLSLCLQQFCVLIASDTAEVMNSTTLFFWQNRLHFVVFFAVCNRDEKLGSVRKGLMAWSVWCDVQFGCLSLAIFCSVVPIWLLVQGFHD